MSRFNNPNLFRIGYNLNWKHNLINLSMQDWKRFLFEYNLLEKVLVKYSYIVLRNFFDQENFQHYLLVYKSKSHRIFKKIKKRRKYRILKPKQFFVEKSRLKFRILKKFFKKFFFYKNFRAFFWLNISFVNICVYTQFIRSITRFSNVSYKSKAYKLFSVIFLRKFLFLTNSNFKYLYSLKSVTGVWRRLQIDFFFSQFFFLIYFFTFFIRYFNGIILNDDNNNVFLTGSSSIYIKWLVFFGLQLFYYLKVFLLNFCNIFFLLRRRLLGFSPKVSFSRNQLWFFNLRQNVYKLTHKPFNFTIFFWNKRDKFSAFGGFTVSKSFIIFLRMVYSSLDFIRQRKFFFFKDTIYLLFISIFFINPRIFTRHLARLFMLMRKHKDLFAVLNWILTSPIVLKWLQLRLFSLHLVVKGRIERSDRAVVRNFGFGRIPRQSISLYLIYSLSSARTWYGSYGVKLWLWFNETSIFS